jgi:3-polyprenyl-4-hydroxybenzoate decarboxylase
MKYNDLRDFIAQLEKKGLLKRISVEVESQKSAIAP